MDTDAFLGMLISFPYDSLLERAMIVSSPLSMYYIASGSNSYDIILA